ncbi:hypothetical protein D1AOALGA4SA_10141 [Olavius algarvensis Delta 1 endosymbiont]|nr:hypothetical protein D1AOALGA4SA_10141 [Olavius algarvensis Delta 1 endosymbiont]
MPDPIPAKYRDLRPASSALPDRRLRGYGDLREFIHRSNRKRT